MKAQLEKSFEVPQSGALVWEHLIDPNKVMDCVPGVTIDEKVGDNHYKGKVGMKFGPMGPSTMQIFTTMKWMPRTVRSYSPGTAWM